MIITSVCNFIRRVMNYSHPRDVSCAANPLEGSCHQLEVDVVLQCGAANADILNLRHWLLIDVQHNEAHHFFKPRWICPDSN